MTVLLAALLAGTATALWVAPGSSRRIDDVVRVRSTPDVPPATRREPAPGGPRPVTLGVASALGGLGVALVVGGVAGLLLGTAAAAVAAVVLVRLEPAAVRRRRERVAADLPTAVDLMGACLAAGRPPVAALDAVLSAVGGPLRDDLGVVVARLRLGADPASVWGDLARAPGPLAPFGRTMARSCDTGAPVGEGLRLLAADLRAQRRAAVERVARAVGVRAAAPLGLCFLPAFVLVGIVPSVVSAVAALSW